MNTSATPTADKCPAGLVRIAKQDTTPGSGAVFAPPAGFSGDYKALMRRRWRRLDWCQHMNATALLTRPGQRGVAFTGPYAAEARGICAALLTAVK